MAITICAVGDIMLAQQPLTHTFGVKDVIRRRGIDYIFNEVKGIFVDSDLVIGNLECSIREKKIPSNIHPDFFCADPETIECLTGAGVDALVIANNHIMENGLPVFQETIRLLKEHQITPIGRINSTDIIERKGKRIGLLAYSFIDDGISEKGYNKISTAEEIIRDIETIKPISDLIIVSVHWGNEYVPFPSPEQVRIGRSLVDAGADIILGGHPHVTQGYEHYKNGLIVYSLGNFIFDQTFIPSTRESFVVKFIVPDSPGPIEVTFVPILIDEHNYQPRIPGPARSLQMLDAVEATRRTIEDHSIEGYQQSIGDYASSYQSCLSEARGYMKSQFLKNLYRYPLSTSYGILRQYIWKKPRRVR